MRVLNTPASLRRLPTPYPKHSVGPTIETAAYSHLLSQQHQIETDLIYLPIFWQNNYFTYRAEAKTRDYGAVPAAQTFIDSLIDPSERYFTISQADEGTYERLPPNVIVFSSGGTGHIAIPLLCDAHTPVSCNRNLLASFIGTVDTGGPVAHAYADKPSRSSWDPNGPGASVRRAMKKAFAGQSDCTVELTLSGQAAQTRFVELACSSKFALAPRGYGRTSFRMYEAMKLGAVPVYIYDEAWLPYCDVLDWEKLVVRCHVDDVANLPDKLRAITDSQIQDFRQYAAEVIPDYFTMEGTCRQIVRYLSLLG